MEEKKREIDWNNIKQQAIERGRRIFLTNHDAAGKPVMPPRPVPESKRKYWMEDRVDRCAGYLRNPDSEWHWVTAHVSDEMLIEVIIELTSGKYDKKRVLANADKTGMKYDETIIQSQVIYLNNQTVEIPEKTSYEIPIKEQIYHNYSRRNPEEKIDDISQILKRHHSEISGDLLLLNQMVFNDLQEEKECADTLPDELFFYQRVHQYVKFSYVFIMETIYFMTFRLNLNSEIGMKNILEKMKENADYIEQYVKKVKSELKHTNMVKSGRDDLPYFELMVDGGIASPILVVFKYRLGVKKIWDEETLIEQSLEAELKNNYQLLKDIPEVTDWAINDEMKKSKMIKQLTGKAHGSTEDYEKVEKMKRFVSKWVEEEGSFGQDDSMILAQIIYREMFMMKTRLSGKGGTTAMTMVSNLIENEELSSRERVFIEKKIDRGKFISLKFTDEYFAYNELRQKYRKILLQVYDIADYDVAYKLLCEINERTLFGIKSYL